MLIELGIALAAWLVLMVVCTNLAGFFWRGFYANPDMETLSSDGDEIISSFAATHLKAQSKITFIALVLILAFLAMLYYFWNAGAVVVSLMLMIGRLPDLHWEIVHGRKLRKGDMASPRFHVVGTVLTWAALPLLWFALYRL